MSQAKRVALASKLGLESEKDLYNVSLTLLKWAIAQAEQGKEVASYDPLTDHVETLSMEVLNIIRPVVKGVHLSVVKAEETDT